MEYVAMSGQVIGFAWAMIASGIFGSIAYILKQPVIPAFILGGVVVGPSGLGLISDSHIIAGTAENAINLVLFVVGLEMDFEKVKSFGPVVLIGGFLQITILTLMGTVISLFWFDLPTAIHFGFAFSFGSTMLVVKMLQDTNKLESATGRIVLGILLVQDMLAIAWLSLAPVGSFDLDLIYQTVLNTSGFIFIFIIIGGAFIIPKIFERIEESGDMLLVSGIGFCFAVALACAQKGLSMSIGSFLAGVALAGLPMRIELIAKAISLRDCFVAVFFSSVGMQLSWPGTEMIVPIIVLTIMCLTVKPLLTAWIVNFFRLSRRISFNTGNFLTPISEFALVIMGTGITVGYVHKDVVVVTILVMTATMIVSSYLTKDKTANWIFKKLGPLAKVSFNGNSLKNINIEKEYFDVVLIGCKKFGSSLLEELENAYDRVAVIDINTDVVRVLKEKGKDIIPGDARESEVWEYLGDRSKIKVVFCTVTDSDFLRDCIPFLRKKCPNAFLVVVSEKADTTIELYADNLKNEGNFYVLCSSTILSRRIKLGKMGHLFDPEKLNPEKKAELEHLIRSSETFKKGSCASIRHLIEEPTILDVKTMEEAN